MKRTPLRRLTPLRAQSKKRKAEAIVRRALVASLLEDRPFCEIQWDERCEGLAVDVDELLGRGVGGSFLAEDNCQTTCRYCHRQKHLNPAEAVRRGFTIQRKSALPCPDCHGTGTTDACTEGWPHPLGDMHGCDTPTSCPCHEETP